MARERTSSGDFDRHDLSRYDIGVAADGPAADQNSVRKNPVALGTSYAVCTVYGMTESSWESSLRTSALFLGHHQP